MKDYYQILGVGKNATADEIKAAYRKLALRWHPDRNPENQEEAKNRFAEINEAYETLSNPDKKAQYDNPNPFGGFGPGMGGGGGTARQWTDADGNMHFEFNGMPGGMGGFPFFEEMFNPFGRHRQNPNAPRQGDTIMLLLSIDFMEALKGCKKQVKLNIEDNCGCLNGCEKCSNTGRVPKTITLDVKVPRGCPQGQRLRVAGQGNRGYNGGPNGDIIFQVNISPHETYGRDGYDILMKLDVPFETFILGGKVDIQTPLDGVKEYDVQPGTKPGKLVVLKGKGSPVMNTINSHGDLKVMLDIVLPSSLSDKERKLLEEYRDLRRMDGK